MTESMNTQFLHGEKLFVREHKTRADGCIFYHDEEPVFFIGYALSQEGETLSDVAVVSDSSGTPLLVPMQLLSRTASSVETVASSKRDNHVEYPCSR